MPESNNKVVNREQIKDAVAATVIKRVKQEAQEQMDSFLMETPVELKKLLKPHSNRSTFTWKQIKVALAKLNFDCDV